MKPYIDKIPNGVRLNLGCPYPKCPHRVEVKWTTEDHPPVPPYGTLNKQIIKLLRAHWKADHV